MIEPFFFSRVYMSQVLSVAVGQVGGWVGINLSLSSVGSLFVLISSTHLYTYMTAKA